MRPSYDSPSGTAADNANAAGPDNSLEQEQEPKCYTIGSLAYVSDEASVWIRQFPNLAISNHQCGELCWELEVGAGS